MASPVPVPTSFLQGNEVRAEIVDAKILRALTEPCGIAAGGQFQDMAEVVNGIIDRRGGEKVERRALPGGGDVALELAVA